MDVSKETRTISLSAQDLASIAGLPSPEQFKFVDGEEHATATIVRDA